MKRETADRLKIAGFIASRIGSLLSTLLLVFVVLKLTKTIAWSWLWVIAPFWIPAATFLLFALFCVVMALIFN